MSNNFLLTAGVFSFIASAAHIGIIIGGASWYRFFGAGEKMAVMAEEGKAYPHIITFFIALVLTGFGLVAWSVAGILPSIPYSNMLLTLITAIYLLRGILGFVAPFIDHPATNENSTKFWLWSSGICTSIGIVHILGLIELTN